MGRVDFEAEVNRIEYLANVNHIRVDLRRMIQKKISRSHLDLTTSIPRRSDLTRREKWIKLPFLGKSSSELIKILRSFGFKPGFYNMLTLKQSLTCSPSSNPSPLSKIRFIMMREAVSTDLNVAIVLAFT